MKKTMILLLVFMLGITLLAGCSPAAKEPDSVSVPDTVASADSSGGNDEQTSVPDASTETTITSGEARTILQEWTDSHPFQLGSALEPESDEQTVDGTAYYRFYLGVERFGVIEILVHKETGALFHYMSPGNTTLEPLDDYYNREHKDY